MTFRLANLLPDPLENQYNPETEIWKTELEFIQGEFTQVRAPSGRGKSTLIQILYGNRTDYHGDVFFDGENIKDLSKRQWAKLRQEKLSIVFQELLLFHDLTGWENIMIKSKLTNHYDEDKIMALAEELGVKPLLDKKCGTMSFGERQRTAIVRAMVQPFDWLLIDEPFSHLDEENARKASKMMVRECKQRSAGMILTSLDGDRFIDFNRKLIL